MEHLDEKFTDYCAEHGKFIGNEYGIVDLCFQDFRDYINDDTISTTSLGQYLSNKGTKKRIRINGKQTIVYTIQVPNPYYDPDELPSDSSDGEENNDVDIFTVAEQLFQNSKPMQCEYNDKNFESPHDAPEFCLPSFILIRKDRPACVDHICKKHKGNILRAYKRHPEKYELLDRGVYTIVKSI